jgi:hypothetical protein
MSIIEILQQIFSATQEQTNAFSEAMKTNGIYTTTHENMDVRYPKLKGEYDSLNSQYGEANKLIEDMKKSTKGQEALQSKITAYEGQVQQLQAELQQTKIDSAIKVGLLSAKAKDVPYMTYKLHEMLKEEGKTAEMDDNGNVKGWDDMLERLQTKNPDHFESAGDNDNGYQVYKPNALHKPDKNEQPINKDTFRGMGYEQRLALKEKNPTLYKQLSGN